MKNRFHVVIKLIAVLLLGVMIIGCASTQHGIEISNVHNVRELYIRNTGTTDWGPNIANNMKNIDRSRFSEKVDIKVIDANGVVYTKDNVPSDFVETGKTSSMNDFALLLLLGGALVLVLTVF